MLQKKALFLVTAENEIQPLVNFAQIFKKNMMLILMLSISRMS